MNNAINQPITGNRSSSQIRAIVQSSSRRLYPMSSGKQISKKTKRQIVTMVFMHPSIGQEVSPMTRGSSWRVARTGNANRDISLGIERLRVLSEQG